MAKEPRDLRYGTENGVPTVLDMDTEKAWIIPMDRTDWVRVGTYDIRETQPISKEHFDKKYPDAPPVPED
jgi:hypothetical protein